MKSIFHEAGDAHALVVGGGIAGRAAAIALQEEGFETAVWDPNGDAGGTLGGRHRVTVWNNGWTAWEALTGTPPLGMIIESFEHRTTGNAVLWRLRSAQLPGGAERSRLVRLEDLRKTLGCRSGVAVETGATVRAWRKSLDEYQRQLRELETLFERALAAGSTHPASELDENDQTTLNGDFGWLYERAGLIPEYFASGRDLQTAMWRSGKEFIEGGVPRKRIVDTLGKYPPERHLDAITVALRGCRTGRTVNADADQVGIAGLALLRQQIARLSEPTALHQVARLARRKAERELQFDKRKLLHFTDAHGQITAYPEKDKPFPCELLIGASGQRCPVRAQLCGDISPRELDQTLFVGWTPHGAAPQLNDLDLSPSSDQSTRIVGFVGRDAWVDLARARVGKPAPDDYWFWIACVRGRHRTYEDLVDAMREFPEGVGAMIRNGIAIDKDDTAKPVPIPLTDLHPVKRASVGSVALVGDAAHGVTLVLGQSVGLALEDAVVLGRELRSHLRDANLSDLNAVDRRNKIRCALASYSRRRAFRTATVNAASHSLARLALDHGLPEDVRRVVESIGMPYAALSLGGGMLCFDPSRIV